MSTCTLTGTLRNVAGQPVAGARVGARVDNQGNAPAFTSSGVALADDVVETETNDNGTFTMTLERGTRVVLHIEAIGLHRQVLVPDLASVTLKELLDANV